MVKRGERRRGKEKKKLYIVLGLNPDSLLPPPTTNFSRRKRNIYFLGVKTRERRRREREKKRRFFYLREIYSDFCGTFLSRWNRRFYYARQMHANASGQMAGPIKCKKGCTEERTTIESCEEWNGESMDLFVARNSPDSNVCNNEQSSSLIAISLPYALRRSIFLFFSSFFLFSFFSRTRRIRTLWYVYNKSRS